MDYLRILMEALETASVPLQSSSPGDRHRKEKHVQSGIIESFAKITWLGYASVQTTEPSPGWKLKLRYAVNDNLGLGDA